MLELLGSVSTHAVENVALGVEHQAGRLWGHPVGFSRLHGHRLAIKLLPTLVILLSSALANLKQFHFI